MITKLHRHRMEYKTKKFNLLPPNDVNDEYLMLMVESLERKGLLS